GLAGAGGRDGRATLVGGADETRKTEPLGARAALVASDAALGGAAGAAGAAGAGAGLVAAITAVHGQQTAKKDKGDAPHRGNISGEARAGRTEHGRYRAQRAQSAIWGHRRSPRRANARIRIPADRTILSPIRIGERERARQCAANHGSGASGASTVAFVIRSIKAVREVPRPSSRSLTCTPLTFNRVSRSPAGASAARPAHGTRYS